MTGNSGQSLVEYSLAAGILVLLTIGGLSAVSTNFVDLFESVGDRMVATGGGTGIPAGGAGGAAASGSATTGGAAGGGGTLPVASSVPASSYPATIDGLNTMLNEMDTLIETSGASGATKTMVSFMKAYVDEAVTAGTISPAVGGQLTQLANLGHTMGNFQNALFTELANAPDDIHRTVFRKQTATIEGKTYAMDSLARGTSMYPHELLKNMSGVEEDAFWDKSLYEKYQIVKAYGFGEVTGRNRIGGDFLKLYGELYESGALDNPEVNGVVSQLASGVAAIAHESWTTGRNFTEWNYDNTIGELKVDSSKGYVDKETHLKEAVKTHVKSGGICTAGDGSDTGTFCNS